MSDTPISDSTPHNVADLGMLCRTLERKLAAATSEIERLTKKVAQLYEGAEEQKQRIKRLEEVGDKLHWAWMNPFDPAGETIVENWTKAKEAKL